jgi:hypothetical protein
MMKIFRTIGTGGELGAYDCKLQSIEEQMAVKGNRGRLTGR